MKSRPKVLMCIDWYLPGFRAGGPIRSCANLVGHLHEDIDFYILTSDRDYQSPVPYGDIRPNEWQDGPSGEQVMYVPTSDMNKSRVLRVLQEEGFDLCYIHGIFSSLFSIAPLRAARQERVPTVVAPRGMLRSSAMELKGLKKRLYLGLAKAQGLFTGLTWHATDEQEQRDIHRWIGPKARVSIAPNLPRLMPKVYEPIAKKPGQLRLIFAGRIAPEKNLAYALEVLALLDSPKIKLDVFGAVYDQSYLKQCKALVATLPHNIMVVFHEPVPAEEVTSLLAKYHALLLPTRGENFGHIILESWMAARPVLISDQTPWQELEAEGAGHSIPLRDMQAFVSSLNMLADADQAAFERLAASSFDKAKRYCKDPMVMAASKALFLPS